MKQHDSLDSLVLRAWGCSAFGNDPQMVAAAFYKRLGPGGGYESRFRHILFAIRDPSPERTIYNAFASMFAPLLIASHPHAWL